MRSLSTLICLLILATSAQSQKGSNQLQISGHIGFPVFDMADGAKTGYGGYARGFLGFSDKPQQVTLTVGYSRFPVKGLPAGAEANLSTTPVLLGYRYFLGGFFLESNAGVGFNNVHIKTTNASTDLSKTSFSWALRAGYRINPVEISVAYQNTGLDSQNEDISFVGLHIGYNFQLGSSR
ncbi:porin family protein [Terrimonas sp. NA20]|uniref:Porin family protein n=1 Tax=Terrimonas ginsenosidimutans TaxID=2908004 RepID=A0ABS9KMJ2_9BACT|nr:outer membrane beta-barrel protein [Terrimonas ginsenosidimutans]MCG2613550.1 porin family protein [Terrimonas ginsenosidimutans]